MLASIHLVEYRDKQIDSDSVWLTDQDVSNIYVHFQTQFVSTFVNVNTEKIRRRRNFLSSWSERLRRVSIMSENFFLLFKDVNRREKVAFVHLNLHAWSIKLKEICSPIISNRRISWSNKILIHSRIFSADKY